MGGWDRCRLLQATRDKEPFYRRGAIQKERVIVLWLGVGAG
jgi:hypothetical protein